MPILGGLELLAGKALWGWLIGGAAAAAVAVVVVAMLYWDRIVGWFQNNENVLLSDPNNIAVMVKQAEKDGKVGVVTGIFNRQTNKVVTAQGYKADNLDGQTKSQFGSNDVCIVT